PWIRLPAAIGSARFLPGKALLKLRDSLDLARDQDRNIHQQARATHVSDLHIFAPQVIAAGRRHVDLEAGRENNFAVAPGVRVDEKREAEFAVPLKESLKPAVMVNVAVRDDDRAQV